MHCLRPLWKKVGNMKFDKHPIIKEWKGVYKMNLYKFFFFANIIVIILLLITIYGYSLNLGWFLIMIGSIFIEVLAIVLQNIERKKVDKKKEKT